MSRPPAVQWIERSLEEQLPALPWITEGPGKRQILRAEALDAERLLAEFGPAALEKSPAQGAADTRELELKSVCKKFNRQGGRGKEAHGALGPGACAHGHQTSQLGGAP